MRLDAAAWRPRAIILFERLGLAGIAVDVLQNILLFPRRSAKNGATFEIIAGFTVPLLLLALLFLVSRRASKAARLALLLLVLAAVAAAIMGGTSEWWSDPPVALGAAALALETVSVAFAFAPSTQAWFRGGGDGQ